MSDTPSNSGAATNFEPGVVERRGPFGLEGPRARAELPMILLASGYHLRAINALRAMFDRRAERVALPLLLWLTAQRAYTEPATSAAARAALAGLLPDRLVNSRRLSLRNIEAATGFPRETVRRSAARLEKTGWVERDPQGGLRIADRFCGWLHDFGNREHLTDFRWTAARIREWSLPNAETFGASVAEALAAMRSTCSEELRASMRWSSPESAPPVLPSAALVLLHGYNLRHLLRLAPLFDGDLLQVALLGEVSIRNMAVLWPQAGQAGGDIANALRLNRPQESIFSDEARGMNALSLAASLGIAYETVRRKLGRLTERRFLQQDDRGRYWVMPHVAEEFRVFNDERRADMLSTADKIENLLTSEQKLPHGERCEPLTTGYAFGV